MIDSNTIRSGAYDPSRAHIIQSFIPAEGEHHALPEDVSKTQAISIIEACLRLQGEPEQRIAVFRMIAENTDRISWHALDKDPINWRRQCDMARQMNMSERTFRRHEKALEGRGVLDRQTAVNGYRGRQRGSRVAAGLSLEPALANYPALALVVEKAKFDEDWRQGEICAVWKTENRIENRILDIADMETRRWAEKARDELWNGGLRPERPRTAETDQLLAWHEALNDLDKRILEALEPCPAPQAKPSSDGSAPDQAPEPVDNTLETPSAADSETRGNARIQHDTSAASDTGVRCQLQPEEEVHESCNAEASRQTPAEAGEDFSSHGRDEKGAGGRAWSVNSKDLAWVTEEHIRDICSEEALFYLDAIEHLGDAVPFLLRDLGINNSAWLEACETMGEGLALLSVLIIDRNRFHPVSPVRNPGGALRAFTRRSRSGELNLARAVIGILERNRLGQQPKGSPRDQDRPATNSWRTVASSAIRPVTNQGRDGGTR